MMHSKNDRKQRHNGNNSRCIMYQSRMRILKSREGTSGRRAKLGERIMCESSFPSSFVDRGTRKPCSAEKLLPPMQLMTKERSFRHLYLKYHPPKVHVRMDFLQKKEDPKIKKKREEIFSRIKAAELASERMKREKERVAGEKRKTIINDVGSLGNSLSEYSGNEDRQDDQTLESLNRQKDTGGLFAEEPNVIVSGFVVDPSKKVDSEATVVSTNTSGSENNIEEELYCDSFAFLADWKKEKRKRMSIRC